MKRTLIVLLLAAALVRFESIASAWGQDGHRMVCRIAFQLLDAPRRNKIIQLSKAFRKPDGTAVPFFTDGCTFPDEARSKARDNVPGWDKFDPFDAWHFLNVPRTTSAIAAAQCGDNCVLTGLAHHAAALAGAADDQARAEALYFLGHWVGDVHQPLHVSYSDDLGGNSIKPINGGFYTSGSLHAVWDSGIIGKAAGADGWRAYADRLAARVTPAEQAGWNSAPPLAWAQESYMVTTVAGADYCDWDGATSCAGTAGPRTLGSGYQAVFQDDVEVRLQQAGVRLAQLLRANLPMP